ncbi:MAG: 4-alpha-glucanotransferase [Oscillospiraceae bacterium]|nr:4-alpha-glucanotransferase [Oscillospiraceae bacterium]
MRKSGILLHISSLPSRYGIGRMGQAAYDFVDFLQESETAYWQILPLSPTSYGDSPYQSFSVYAGNPYFIDFEKLEEQGLLEHEDYASMLWQRTPDSVDYELLYRNNITVLKRAFARFQQKPSRGYQSFKNHNKDWLPEYALFMALKDSYEGRPWYEWEPELAMREKTALEKVKKQFAEEIELYCFVQFVFSQQWTALKKYANQHHVQMIGDMPIYVSYDSADVWVSPELFDLDKDKKPVEVAGCPPDPFSPTGQLWGNPLYQWEYHKKTNYAWWTSRLKFASSLYDVIRIDHFRGFESYYAIPFGSENAVKGRWRKGPNKKLFQTVSQQLGELHIIAEDLGFITPAVRTMLKALHYPGMKVLQFGFDSDPDNEHLPHNFQTSHCVVYTGTHDNETLNGWLEASEKKTVKYAKKYLRAGKKSDIPDAMIACAWQSIAELAVAQMQDFLHEEKSGRMNTPSTLGGNWQYRTREEDFSPELAKQIQKLNRIYGRAFKPEEASAPKRKYTRRKAKTSGQTETEDIAVAEETAVSPQEKA